MRSSTPATGSSARCRAGLPRSSRRRAANGACPTAMSSARRPAAPRGSRYGDGILYTKNAGDLRVFWQGPSVGFDFGGEGARTVMLIYSLPATDAIWRFVGIDGSAYFVGGLGMTALTASNVVVVPIRTGVGLRLGANVGYLKFTRPRPGTRSERRTGEPKGSSGAASHGCWRWNPPETARSPPRPDPG